MNNSQLYIVMEYVAGGSVKDIIKLRGPIPEIYIPILLRRNPSGAPLLAHRKEDPPRCKGSEYPALHGWAGQTRRISELRRR